MDSTCGQRGKVEDLRLPFALDKGTRVGTIHIPS